MPRYHQREDDFAPEVNEALLRDREKLASFLTTEPEKRCQHSLDNLVKLPSIAFETVLIRDCF
jgi:hypothetical protein